MSTTMTLTQYTSSTTETCSRNTYNESSPIIHISNGGLDRLGSFLFAVAKKTSKIAYEVFKILLHSLSVCSSFFISYIYGPFILAATESADRVAQAFFPRAERADINFASHAHYSDNGDYIYLADEPIPEFDDIPFENVREELKEEGIEFIVKNIFNNITPKMQSLIEMCDEGIYTYVVTKALFIYTLGSKSKEPIPEFFKDVTMAAIAELRTKLPKALATNAKLLEAINDIDLYETLLAEDTKAETEPRNALKRLSEASYEESKGGLFLNECCLRALKKIGQFA